jgi:hypothetical protein
MNNGNSAYAAAVVVVAWVVFMSLLCLVLTRV